jgi:hypothetical protein
VVPNITGSAGLQHGARDWWWLDVAARRHSWLPTRRKHRREGHDEAMAMVEQGFATRMAGVLAVTVACSSRRWLSWWRGTARCRRRLWAQGEAMVERSNEEGRGWSGGGGLEGAQGSSG